jgi:oligopeptide/dipeptide ABC transporter ATP-binding protein
MVGSKRLPTIPGAVPQLGSWPQGCRFHPRCELATEACVAAQVALVEQEPERAARCIRTEELISL